MSGITLQDRSLDKLTHSLLLLLYGHKRSEKIKLLFTKHKTFFLVRQVFLYLGTCCEIKKEMTRMSEVSDSVGELASHSLSRPRFFLPLTKIVLCLVYIQGNALHQFADIKEIFLHTDSNFTPLSGCDRSQ